jgi:hypothetical protein
MDSSLIANGADLFLVKVAANSSSDLRCRTPAARERLREVCEEADLGRGAPGPFPPPCLFPLAWLMIVSQRPCLFR